MWRDQLEVSLGCSTLAKHTPEILRNRQAKHKKHSRVHIPCWARYTLNLFKSWIIVCFCWYNCIFVLSNLYWVIWKEGLRDHLFRAGVRNLCHLLSFGCTWKMACHIDVATVGLWSIWSYSCCLRCCWCCFSCCCSTANILRWRLMWQWRWQRRTSVWGRTKRPYEQTWLFRLYGLLYCPWL